MWREIYLAGVEVGEGATYVRGEGNAEPPRKRLGPIMYVQPQVPYTAMPAVQDKPNKQNLSSPFSMYSDIMNILPSGARESPR